jgi:hypothetical protein
MKLLPGCTLNKIKAPQLKTHQHFWCLLLVIKATRNSFSFGFRMRNIGFSTIFLVAHPVHRKAKYAKSIFLIPCL